MKVLKHQFESQIAIIGNGLGLPFVLAQQSIK